MLTPLSSDAAMPNHGVTSSQKTMLVSVRELADSRDWRVVDCSHDLSQPASGAALYAQGHLPGAIHAHLDHDLSGIMSGSNGRHPLPDRAAFARWLGSVGLRNGDQVVAYDRSGGIFAARFWWLLRWVGHRSAAVLDGGFQAWSDQSLPISTAQPRPHVAEFRPGSASVSIVDTAFVLRNLQQRNAVLVDARGANRFAGRDETMDPVAGHIPGALNRPYADNLDEHGMFKSAAQLRQEFDRILTGSPAQVVAQCGSGVTACHNLLALEIAGLPGASLYPGSWSEWCSDKSRPVVAAGNT